MSNFRPASMNDDDENDDENEDNPLLRRGPTFEDLRQHSRLDELLAVSFGTRLQSATVMLLLGFGRLQRFASRLLLDSRELLLAFKTWAWENPKQLSLICIGITQLILACATPAILGAIGFSAVGPVAGSIAAGWQASMGGYVVAGSLFAYLQSAAMGGAAIGLFAGIGAVGGVAAVAGVGASVNVVRERIFTIGEVVGEKFADAGEVLKKQAVQAGGVIADGAVRIRGSAAHAAVHVGQVVGGWWGKATGKLKGK